MKSVYLESDCRPVAYALETLGFSHIIGQDKS